MPTLSLPVTGVRSSFLEAMKELRLDGRGSPSDNTMLGRDLREWTGRWESAEGFSTFVSYLLAQSEDATPRPAGWVPDTTWWWVDGPAFLGRIALRHRLTEYLRTVGGHIGYDVRPSARRRGHATAMLAAVLPHAYARGIDPALVTCDVDNIASRRVIESNGGVLENVLQGKLRFWVPTGVSVKDR
jgi:predicted acetyltransferase